MIRISMLYFVVLFLFPFFSSFLTSSSDFVFSLTYKDTAKPTSTVLSVSDQSMEMFYTLRGAETPRNHVGTESICAMRPVWQAPQNHHNGEWLVHVRDAISPHGDASFSLAVGVAPCRFSIQMEHSELIKADGMYSSR